MSASQKKKLRKELNAAAMTEKQQQEMKEAKKLRLQTTLFTIVIALMVAVVIFTTVTSSGIIERNTAAITVGGTKVSAAELKHYYIDSVNNFYSQYGTYAALFGLDATKPLDEQVYDEESGDTWADYFLDSAIDSARYMYALYNAAKAEGYTLTEENEATIQSNLDTLLIYATYYGYGSVDSYINAVYGAGCDENTYRDYCEVQLIASRYSADHQASLSYTEDEIRAAEAENYDAYTSYTYNYYYLPVSSFVEGGTTDEDGKVTYSDAEKEAGRVACEEAANSLLTSVSTVAFDKAIAGLSINEDSDTAASTRQENQLYANISATFSEWITDAARVEGEMTIIPSESTSTDEDGTETTTVNGYYVLRFESKNENLTKLVNVRHILIAPEHNHTEGESHDHSSGTYTEAELAAAKEEAEALMAQFLAGDVTEDAFAALANEHSTDTGSNTNGGLYENVYPGQMVVNFNDWCFNANRKAGDTGIVESDYGYHIMYYVGQAETTYRDFMITNTLRNNEMTEWENGLYEAAELVVKNTSDINMSLVLNSGSSSHSH